MTETSDKVRGLFLATLMVLSVFAGTVALSGTAAAVSNQRTDVTGTAPVLVFVGEQGVDLTGMTTTNANSPSGSVSLVGETGDADGAFETVTAGDADFNGFSTGGYYVQGDGDSEVDIIVQNPQITEVKLFQTFGSSASTSGADVTNGAVAESANLTVRTRFNFDSASYVKIAVENPAGSDIAQQLTTNPKANFSGNLTFLDLQNADLRAGEYTVTAYAPGTDEFESQSSVMGNKDTELQAQRSVSFEIRIQDTTIEANPTTLTQGERSTITVTGTPGENVTVAMDEDDLDAPVDWMDVMDIRTGVFRTLGDSLSVNNSSADERIGVVLELGDDGEASVQVDSDYLEDDTTVEFDAIEDTSPAAPDLDGDEEDSVDITVNQRDVTVSESPSNVVSGSDFTIEGSAPESDRVVAYARIDDEWIPLRGEDGDDYATDRTDINDEFEIDASATNPLHITGSYQVGVAAYSTNDISMSREWTDADNEGSIDEGTEPNKVDSSFDSDAWSELRKTTFGLRVVGGELTASLSRNQVADSVDEITLNGTAIGQKIGGNKRVVWIRVGPRGDIENDTINVEDDDSFEEDEFPVPGLRGQHNVVVVGAGRDGQVTEEGYDNYGDALDDIHNRAGNNADRRQAMAIIDDVFSGAGVDDQMVRLNLQVQSPTITVNAVNGNERFTAPAEAGVTISGDSNLEEDETVILELLADNGTIIISGDGEVNEDGTWEGEIDLSDVEEGNYNLEVDASDASTSITLGVGQTPTQTETVTTSPPPTTTTTMEQTTSLPPTTTMATTGIPPSPTPGTTTSSGPGFGVIVAALALLGGAFLALRRRE